MGIISKGRAPAVSQSGELPFHGINANRNSNRILGCRVLFLAFLCGVAALLGHAAHTVLTKSERDLSETHFESIADRALDTALEILLRKRLGTLSMASIASYQFPDAESWPFVIINGYEAISSSLIETSSGREMGFCPFVTPEQLPLFEEFAYEYYEEQFPLGAAESSFGNGVYGIDPALNTTDNHYRETDGSTPYDSPNKIFVPVLQHNAGANPALMLNLHFQETRGTLIDNLITCSKTNTEECNSITDMLTLTSQEVGTGPGALIMQGIYPANNETILVGAIASSIVWGDVLENVFADEVSGIDCVLETETRVYTYSVVDGVAALSGEGDLHDVKFDNYRRSVLLTKTGLFSSSSASYTLTLYPNEELFDVYSTQNPNVATAGTVCIIIFTSFLFILYDFFVRQEFNVKRSVLEAKRNFVRFVSHEVRTPLNAVCTGLQLMQEEIREAQSNFSDNKAEMVGLTEDILCSATSAVDILNDLLNYDKVEMGTLSLERTIVPIWDLIERTSAEFKLTAKAKKIDFKLDFSALADTDEESLNIINLPQDISERRVLGDALRIAQVLRNVMSNGLKFTPDGGKLTVKVFWVKPPVAHSGNGGALEKQALGSGESVTCAQSGQIKVTVTDTGAGLSEEQLKQLFSDGIQFNVNQLQAGQGSGLGLYIAKGIVEQHGGILSAASEGLGQGSTFTMTLPVYHIPDSALPRSLEHLQKHKLTETEQNSTKTQESSLHHYGPLRTLVVDDAVTNRKLLARLLARRGHSCDQAQDGQEAVQKVMESLKDGNPYTTILMDFEMPVMDGPTASKAIRALGCDSLIVGVTGNALPEDIAHFRSCGANAVVLKPFEMEALEEILVEFGVKQRSN